MPMDTGLVAQTVAKPLKRQDGDTAAIRTKIDEAVSGVGDAAQSFGGLDAGLNLGQELGQTFTAGVVLGFGQTVAQGLGALSERVNQAAQPQALTIEQIDAALAALGPGEDSLW